MPHSLAVSAVSSGCQCRIRRQMRCWCATGVTPNSSPWQTTRRGERSTNLSLVVVVFLDEASGRRGSSARLPVEASRRRSPQLDQRASRSIQRQSPRVVSDRFRDVTTSVASGDDERHRPFAGLLVGIGNHDRPLGGNGHNTNGRNSAAGLLVACQQARACAMIAATATSIFRGESGCAFVTTVP